MKNLQASYNNDATNIIEIAKEDKASQDNINFLFVLLVISLVAENKEATEEEPITFDKACNHADEELQRNF